MADTEAMATDPIESVAPEAVPEPLTDTNNSTPASTSLKRKASVEPGSPRDESAKKPRVTSHFHSRSRSVSPRRSRSRSRVDSRRRSRSCSRSYSRSLSRSRSRSRSRSPARRRSLTPPERKAEREKARQEDQKRGKRLFGGLLSTLNKSQAGQRNVQATKRRQEIEERQQIKLKQQRVEGEKIRAVRGRKLKKLRLTEQIVFEEEVMLARHETMRMQARCLKTKSKPPLYYRPWKLTRAQEREIDNQLDDVEERIDDELIAFSRKREEAIARFGSPIRRVTTPEPYPRRRGRSRTVSRSPSRSISRMRSPSEGGHRKRSPSHVVASPSEKRVDDLDYGDGEQIAKSKLAIDRDTEMMDETLSHGCTVVQGTQPPMGSGTADDMDIDDDNAGSQHHLTRNIDSSDDGATDQDGSVVPGVTVNSGVKATEDEVPNPELLGNGPVAGDSNATASVKTVTDETQARDVTDVAKQADVMGNVITTSGGSSTVTFAAASGRVLEPVVEESKTSDATSSIDSNQGENKQHKENDELGDVVLEADEDTLIY